MRSYVVTSLRAYVWRLRCATMPSPSNPTPSSASDAGSGTAAGVAENVPYRLLVKLPRLAPTVWKAGVMPGTPTRSRSD